MGAGIGQDFVKLYVPHCDLCHSSLVYWLHPTYNTVFRDVADGGPRSHWLVCSKCHELILDNERIKLNARAWAIEMYVFKTIIYPQDPKARRRELRRIKRDAENLCNRFWETHKDEFVPFG